MGVAGTVIRYQAQVNKAVKRSFCVRCPPLSVVGGMSHIWAFLMGFALISGESTDGLIKS